MIAKSLLGGLASLAVVGAASAADLPRRQAPPPVFVPVPVFTWTGFYLGTHSSYAFSDRQNIRTTGNDTLTQTNVALQPAPAELPLGAGWHRQHRWRHRL